MKRTFIYGIILIGVLWTNARMLDHVADYDWMHVVDLPREFRFFEVGFIGLFFAVAFRNAWKEGWRRRLDHVRFPLILVTLAFLAGALNGSTPVDIFQGMFLFLSPLMVYQTARWLDLRGEDLRSIVRTMALLLLLSLPLWLYQVLTFFVEDGNGDNVHAFFRDAHLYANLLYCGVLVAAASFAVRRRYLDLLAAGALFFVAFMPLNEKSMIFMVFLLLAVLLFRRGERKARRRLMPAFILTAVLVVGFLVGRDLLSSTGGEGLRANILTENRLEDLGTVLAYLQLPFVFEEVPQALVYGVGPGNYGSSMAIRRSVEGSATELSTRYVGDIEVSGVIGAFSWRTNYFIGMLVEYGAIFTAIVALFYLSLARRLYRLAKSSASEVIVVWSLALGGSLMLLLLTGLVSNISGLDEGILAYPILMGIAALENEAAEGGQKSLVGVHR
ncbi:MAG: hypothetical protein MUE68_09150 [Bacteroidetes bacterium]|jgi:uncharacterized membrane protein|nr:hypothetical protein [Bacteroidota bacterium]